MPEPSNNRTTFDDLVIESDVSPRVSPFLNEGTFSGADIRVHVHLDDIKSQTKKVQDQINDEERRIGIQNDRITELINKKETSGLSNTENVERNTLASQIRVTRGTINFLQEKIVAIDRLPSTKLLGELQTVSYSVNREKVPVRTLGSVYPRSYVRGPRTIGGTMIFTIFNEHVLHEILSLDLGVINTGTADKDTENPYTTALPDQLPPLNLSLVFANEHGAISHRGLYGVEFVL